MALLYVALRMSVPGRNVGTGSGCARNSGNGGGKGKARTRPYGELWREGRIYFFPVPGAAPERERCQEIQNNYRIGYFGSLFMRINFGKHFLQPEVSYTVNSCDISFDKPLPEGSNANDIPEKASIASTIHSVDVPVIYGYNIIKEGPYSLAIFGGPKIRFMLQKQSDITFENFDQTDIHETLRPLNLCATLGVAVTISRIFFDFRYDVGLHNMSKQIEYTVPPVEGMPGTVEPDKGIYFHRKDNVMSFSLGVFF